MQINIVSCIYVLDSQKNTNIRRNDIKKLQVLVTNKKELPIISYQGKDMKEEVRKNISSIIGSKLFHLEQVYTMDYKDSIDIVYLAITNRENITKLKDDYQLVDFQVKENKYLTFDQDIYEYETIEKEENNNIEYFHKIKNVKDSRYLIELLTSYKRIRNNIDNTDIVFKFMGKTFTLEDVRIVYELIKDCSVDKSNFRKKIIKYCEKTEDTNNTKNGFRPSQKYQFKPLKGDIWL